MTSEEKRVKLTKDEHRFLAVLAQYDAGVPRKAFYTPDFGWSAMRMKLKYRGLCLFNRRLSAWTITPAGRLALAQSEVE